MKIILGKSFFLSAAICLLAFQSYALEKQENGICILSADVLADPELLVKDVLENVQQNTHQNCHDVYLNGMEKRDGIAFPKNSYKKIKDAGYGIFRDYKIKSSKPGPDLEGYKTLIYEVEMVYVAMERDGPTAPICEYSVVPVRLVNTPWGWRYLNRYIFGSNLKAEIKMVHGKKEIANSNKNFEDMSRKYAKWLKTQVV